MYLKNETTQTYEKVKVKNSQNISYCMPQRLNKKSQGKTTIYLRANANFLRKNIVVKCGEEIIAKKFCVGITTGEMQEIEVEAQEDYRASESGQSYSRNRILSGTLSQFPMLFG